MLPMQAKSWIETYGGWVGLGGLIVGLVSIVLAVWFRPRQSKVLGWKYQSANRIISVTPAQLNKLRLRVVYGELDVDNPNIIVLRISNAGRQEIRVGDFDRPITVEFKQSQLLALNVIGQSTPSMKVSFKVDSLAPNRVTLNPLLLNAGEWVELQFVTDGDIERPPVGARIVGQTGEPFDIRAAVWQRSDVMTLATAVVTVIMLLMVISIMVTMPSGRWPSSIGLFFLVYGYFMFTGIMANRKVRRSR